MLMAAAASPALAQQGAAREDPFVRLAEDIWSAVQRSCEPPEGRPLQVAVIGVAPGDVRFTADQKDFLAQKLTGAMSILMRQTPATRARIVMRNVAEVIAIMGSGAGRGEVERLLREAENYNVGITVTGGRFVGRGYRIALGAFGRNGVACQEQTSAIELPPDTFPENIVSADELLSRAAQHVLEKDRQSAAPVVSMQLRMADGQPAPEIWNESLARSFNRSVRLARERIEVRSLEEKDIRAEAVRPGQPQLVGADRWSADIVLNTRQRVGTRLEVDLRPPSNARLEGTAYDGLIDPESLPPLQMTPEPTSVAVALAPAVAPQPATVAMPAAAPATAPVVEPAPAALPAPAPFTPTSSPASAELAQGPALASLPVSPPPAPMAAAAAPRAVSPPAATPAAQAAPQPERKPTLPLSNSAQRLRLALAPANPRQEFVFSAPESMVLEVDLQQASVEDQLSVVVLDANNGVEASVGQPLAARPYLTRWRLERGDYTLSVGGRIQKPLDLVLRTRASLDALTVEPLGTLVRVAGDWAVGVRETPNGGRVCYAFTSAVMTQPARWRVVSPFLLFQITPDDDVVQHRFDGVGDWAKPEAIQAQVQRAGRWERLPLRPIDGVMQSAEPCKGQKGMCLTETTLFGLSTGARVSLTGAAKDGRQGVIDYSLNGYQAAMYAMASLCNRKTLAARMVIRR
jgi:hypothetical protein